MVRIAVDVMGGDFAPKAALEGIIEAIDKHAQLYVIAVGDEDAIKRFLIDKAYDEKRLKIYHTDEVIETAEQPVSAVKAKRNSSLVRAVRLVKEGEADGALSAGNSGALLVAAQAYLKRIKGVKRTPLAPVIPTLKGPGILVDCGANIDARPEHLLTFAKLGSIYLENVCSIKNPKVAIVNIGAEEEKGNKLVKETFPLLRECKEINFIGSIEAREILSGYADVIVCDAFVGNVILKLTEGILNIGKDMLKETIMSSIKTKIGALLLKNKLKQSMTPFDVSRYGGAPLLGLSGLVVKCHGNAKKKEFYNSLTQSLDFVKLGINDIIKTHMEETNERVREDS